MKGWTMAMKLACSLPPQVPITDTVPPMRGSPAAGEPSAAGAAEGKLLGEAALAADGEATTWATGFAPAEGEVAGTGPDPAGAPVGAAAAVGAAGAEVG